MGETKYAFGHISEGSVSAGTMKLFAYSPCSELLAECICVQARTLAKEIFMTSGRFCMRMNQCACHFFVSRKKS